MAESRGMAWRIRNGVWLGVALVIACGDLAQPPPASAPSPRASLTVQVDPPLIGDRVAPIVHFLLSHLPAGAQPPPTLIEGQASARNLRDLAHDDASKTLRDRVIETTAWIGEDGIWTVAPHEPLALGGAYSLVAPSVGWTHTFDVIDHDDVPTLKRTWPPKDASGAHLVWCLDWPTSGVVPSTPTPLLLLPSTPGIADHGAMAGLGDACIHWHPDAVGMQVVIPPVLLTIGDGRNARVDPSPVAIDGGAENDMQPACGPDEQPVGPLCVGVQDDRAIVTVQDTTWLVGLEMNGRSWVDEVAPLDPWVLRPLAPSSWMQGTLQVVSSAGQRQRFEVSWQTMQPSVHLVLNEVMANPCGPEPRQEWVELYNDGMLDAVLDGWKIEDAAGSTDLPAALLRSGQFALVVSEAYDPESWVDEPPAPGTLLLRVPFLGKSGLSNGGEPLRLVDPTGAMQSSVPAIASKHSGWSIARVAPDAPDDCSCSFMFSKEGGSPGAENEPPVSEE